MTAPAPAPWRKSITKNQWRTLGAAQLGWTLDGMDSMLYAFALSSIRDELKLGDAAAGAPVSVMMITSAIGGAFAGYFADRWGRARVLACAIAVYSVFTGLTGTAHSLLELVIWRALLGFGLGAVWSSGSVLVAETWSAENRGKAIGFMQAGWAIGYMLAAILAGLILPSWGWRPLFLLGVLPALSGIWIWRSVPEPAIWRETRQKVAQLKTPRVPIGVVLRPPILNRFIFATLLCASMQFAYWGLFTWIPTYLSTPIANGGAGLSVVKSMTWIIPAQIGAFLGYSSFGLLADRFGRKPVFQVWVLSAAAVVPVYGLAARSQLTLLILGPLVGFFAHGYFSVFGAMLAELFPSTVRATAQGFAYNTGRAISAFAPIAIGAFAARFGIGNALAFTAAFFVLGAVLMTFLPETKGEQLQ